MEYKTTKAPRTRRAFFNLGEMFVSERANPGQEYLRGTTVRLLFSFEDL